MKDLESCGYILARMAAGHRLSLTGWCHIAGLPVFLDTVASRLSGLAAEIRRAGEDG